MFKLISEVNKQQAIIEFDAIFKNQKICWCAQIATLDYWYQIDRLEIQDVKRQFIYIKAGQTGEKRYVEVGLNLEQIDKPTLLKTVIMLKQYKKLDEGWHEFGDMI